MQGVPVVHTGNHVMKRHFVLAIATALLVAACAAAQNDASKAESDQELSRQISRLVQQLDVAQAADREAAEKQLLDMASTAPGGADHFLELLPVENDQMPLAVR